MEKNHSQQNHHKPPQKQEKQPGIEKEMRPRPQAENLEIQGCNRLANKVALITGGDSGIGRAVAIAYAKEGADICITYLNEHEDAKDTAKIIESYNRKCISIAGDISDENFCQEIIKMVLIEYKKLDILVNNAAVQFPKSCIEEITQEQLEKTFKINIFSYFYLTKHALPHLNKDSSIINSTSVTAYKGSADLIDYSSTKGAIVSFTRSLALSLIEKNIRVNAVAPGPIWTPLIPSSFDEEKVAKFGSQVPMQRPGEPWEVAYCYVFLASSESSYITGQVLHPNGGVIVNG